MKLRAHEKQHTAASDWIDSLPGGWERKPLKHAVRVNRAVLSENTPADARIRYVDISNVDSEGNISSPEEMTFDKAPSRARRVVSDGDTIVSTVRTYLRAIAYIHEPPSNLIVSTGFAVLTPRLNLEPRFLAYFTRSEQFIGAVVAHSTGVSYPAINPSLLGGLPIGFPNRENQKRIADFLDRETARVDGMIGKKMELLRLLEEKRASLISHAVTRGLDPAAKLRDSGIPWLGKIPAHWEVWRIGHLARVGNGSTPNRDNRDYWAGGKHPWLNSSVVNDDLVTQAPDFVTDVALRECHLPMVPRGSVLVALTGEGKTRGKAAVLDFTATINQHIAYITPRPALMDSRYLQRQLTRGYEALRVLSDGAGSTKGAVTCEQLRNLRVVVPPPHEQRNIIAALTKQLSTVDRLKEALRNSIALLREHRTALISAVVTGKIDVHNS